MNERSFFKTYPPQIFELYEELLAILKDIGPYKAEVKTTSIHLTNIKFFQITSASQMGKGFQVLVNEAYLLLNN